MKCALALLLCLLSQGCASLSPREHAEQVAGMPGRKPLRVGVVTLGSERVLPEALPATAAAPGGAAPRTPVGAFYAERTLLPESMPADEVLEALQRLSAFTDVVLLPFDSRGLASREGVIQRIQDRIWSVAAAQELDALLVVEGVRDGGLRWSNAEEGLFSLDTVLWWVTWPFGLWLADRSYEADCELQAMLFWLGDNSSSPVPIDLIATAGAESLHPWERANSPLLGLLLPPAWVADDEAAVTTAVTNWSRAMLPINLVRQIKTVSFPSPGNTELSLTHTADHYRLVMHSDAEFTAATVTALPRGALADTTARTSTNLELTNTIELSPRGPRHQGEARLPKALVEQAGCSLVRIVVTLASGEQSSQTWAIADLPR